MKPTLMQVKAIQLERTEWNHFASNLHHCYTPKQAFLEDQSHKYMANKQGIY